MSQSALLGWAGRGSVLSAVVLLATACGDPTTPRDVAPSPTSAASAAAAALAAAPALTVTVGTGPIVQGVTILATAAINGRPTPLPNASLSWHSSNTAVATVSPAGVVTSVASGTATITATFGEANHASSGSVSSAVSGSSTIIVGQLAVTSPAGGTVSGYAGDVTLVLPQGALTTTTPITVTLDPEAEDTPNTVGPAYEFGPSGTQFDQPVEMALKYDPTLLPPNTDQGTLRVARFEDGVWVPLTEAVSVDSITNTVRAATRHFSPYRVVADPCALKNGNPTVISGTITTSDCLFVASQRYSDYYRMVPPANTVTVIRWTRDFAGVFGMKESTADVAAGLVYGSIFGTTPELRIVGNGDPMQLFVSGMTSTTTGAYTLTKSAAVGHACTSGGAAPILYIVPGASYQDAVTAQNSCTFNIQFSPFPAVIGKPILAHYLVAKLDAGKPYTISVSGMPGQSALTIFRSGVVAAQNVGPTVNGVRTVTVTPATAGNYAIEISSGGFQLANFQGDWIQPVINYTLSVSRGATP
ncbi:MAG: Ig-like domain-containing protein [Gemmatimonadota bacterium]|nr:Ig-like domain-containing protein [Gemmatimonadota bacterium]